MTAQEYRPIPRLERYEINRQGTLRRAGNIIKGTARRSCHTYSFWIGGKRCAIAARQLVIRTFGEAWPRHRPYVAPERTRHLGEDHGRHKLVTEEVLEIRARLKGGDTERALAAEYGVTNTAIHWISKRKTWKHITD